MLSRALDTILSGQIIDDLEQQRQGFTKFTPNIVINVGSIAAVGLAMSLWVLSPTAQFAYTKAILVYQ